MFGLGCVAGAAGLAALLIYVRAFSDQIAGSAGSRNFALSRGSATM